MHGVIITSYILWTILLIKWAIHNSYLTVIGVHEMHAWSNAPQLLSDNYFVGNWPLFIIGLLYNDLTPSHSRQIAYKYFGC